MAIKWRRVSLYLFVALCAGLLLANIAKSDSAPVDIESENGADSGTDTLSEEREAASIQKQERSFRDKAEKFEFQAEVSRLMDIIINSLYSNKDIFLRELISNASDALDKIRFLALTDASQLTDDLELDIRLKIDKENKILSIRDTGIGMTRDELVKNLGTIAKSGTSAFLDQVAAGGDVNLIGQFGVGFYSVYLVADYVEVISKNNNDVQHIWESGADGNFAVSADDENEPLGRGTEIRIHLKDEAMEYMQEDTLRSLVKKYSEFINFPIYLWTSKTITKEVPIEEEEEEVDTDDEEAGVDEEEDVEIEEDAEEEEDEPKTKTITEEVFEWERLNDSKAIWLRSSSEVSDEEYNEFYKAMTKEFSDPLAHTHFSAEGDVEFRSILFIPSNPPTNMFGEYYQQGSKLKLYVRRVFISDEFEELLPKYLSFIRGIVDSDSLPLNVSREMLQQHSSLKTIKKKLVRKVLDMIKKLADESKEDDDVFEDDVEDEEEYEEEEDEEVEEEETVDSYKDFWKNYGKAIKMGIIEDSSNRTRLAKLLRFYTSKSEDELVSLEEYVDRMNEDQKGIFFIIGTSMEEIKRSPLLETLLEEDIEVIFFVDPLDEYVMQNLTEFDDHKFQNVAKDELKLKDKSEDEKELEKRTKEYFKPLLKWWKEILEADGVSQVRLSKRLKSTPLTVVTDKFGWSANMERIMRAQALADNSENQYMKAKKILEINPRHPLVQEMLARVSESPEDEGLKKTAQIMYDTALLENGFVIERSQESSARILDLIRRNLDISEGAPMVDPDLPEPEPEPEPEEEEGDVPEDVEAEEEEAAEDTAAHEEL